MSPNTAPWPWPADAALDRARRVAAMYRTGLADSDPARCSQLDEQMRAFGQTWVLPGVAHDPDDLLTAELAADAIGIRRRTIYAWREQGLPVCTTPDGPRYRYGDLVEFAAQRRRRRVR